MRLLLIILLLPALCSATPNIIFNSIMKSGSTYIVRGLKVGLGYNVESVNKTPFNLYWKDFVHKDNLISKQHSLPTDSYLKEINKYDDMKMVVHVRDPRQAIVSLAHYYNHPKERKLWKKFGLPEGYYHLTWSQQIDWNIEYKLPQMVKFIEEWLAIKDHADSKKNGLQILVTTYEELITNELNLYYKILDFYEIPRSDFKYINLEKNEEVLYRKADVNEWRSELTEQQKQRVAEIVPESLLQRFGWEK